MSTNDSRIFYVCKAQRQKAEAIEADEGQQSKAAATEEGHRRAGHGNGRLTIVEDTLKPCEERPYYGLRNFKYL